MEKKFISKLAILSISIFLMSHLAISPAIPQLYDFYHGINSNIGLASVENLATIPAMMITIFVLFSTMMVKFIGKKNTVLLGLTLTLLAGIIPFFVTSFKLVLISRLCLGAGIGLFNSLSISILSDFYFDDERGVMIGWRTAFLNIGKAITTFLSGYLAVFGVQYTFLVYLLVIPIFILFYFYVPKLEKTEDKKVNVKINSRVILLTLLTFFMGICYLGSTIKIPTLLVKYYHMDPLFGNNLLTILAISGTVIGAIFGLVVKKIKNITLIITLSFMVVGSFIFAVSSNVFLFYIGAILIGASFVGTMSFNFFYISRHIETRFVNFATSLILVGGNIGVILTPLVLTKLPEKLKLEPYVTPFYIISFIMLVCTIITFALLKKNKEI